MEARRVFECWSIGIKILEKMFVLPILKSSKANCPVGRLPCRIYQKILTGSTFLSHLVC